MRRYCLTLAPDFCAGGDTMEVTDGNGAWWRHYNAPSYTVGEPGRIKTPGRRKWARISAEEGNFADVAAE